MHILTKIFIVLVALLSVLLVPLVVTYVHNEDAYQKRFQAAEAQSAASRSQLEAERASFAANLSRKDTQLQEQGSVNRDLRRQLDQSDRETRELKARITEAEAMDADIRAHLSTLSSAVDAGQTLTESLVNEIRQLRRDALSSERQKVELDEALRESQAELEVAERARRALAEELQRLKDEKAAAIETISRYVAAYGDLAADRNRAAVGGLPDIDLDARIVRVRRMADQSLAEIDAGSRDGVKVGWIVPIGREDFIANLRIIEVDINTATGVIEMENVDTRGRVEVGDRVLIRRR